MRDCGCHLFFIPSGASLGETLDIFSLTWAVPFVFWGVMTRGPVLPDSASESLKLHTLPQAALSRRVSDGLGREVLIDLVEGRWSWLAEQLPGALNFRNTQWNLAFLKQQKLQLRGV